MGFCFPCGPISTKCVCGTFDEPTIRDEGRCAPYRVKRDCEAPVIPPQACPNEVITTEYDPTRTPPFRVVGQLMDSNCETITDSNGEVITTYLT